MQRDSMTYCGEPEDKEDYAVWRATFDLSAKKSEIGKITTDNAFMAELQSRIVPIIVEYDDFWTRYFFGCVRVCVCACMCACVRVSGIPYHVYNTHITSHHVPHTSMHLSYLVHTNTGTHACLPLCTCMECKHVLHAVLPLHVNTCAPNVLAPLSTCMYELCMCVRVCVKIPQAAAEGGAAPGAHTAGQVAADGGGGHGLGR